MRPMTHLLIVLEPSAMSKLLSACSKPPSTPLGSYPNVLKSFHRNILKNICLNRILSIKYWIADIFKIFLPKAIFDLRRGKPEG
jgi:hypothetical protein